MGAKVYNTYMFEDPVSPHLAARRAGVEIRKEKILEDFCSIDGEVIVEGAGGIFTPLGEDLNQAYIIKMLGLSVVVVADAGLGTINATVLTLEFAKQHGIDVKGVILNRYDADNYMHVDNKIQIEKYAQVIKCLS
jgi:dethiobiotin synthetase